MVQEDFIQQIRVSKRGYDTRGEVSIKREEDLSRYKELSTCFGGSQGRLDHIEEHSFVFPTRQNARLRDTRLDNRDTTRVQDVQLNHA